MESTLQSELDKQVKLGEIEVFTPEQIKSFVDDANAVISKSEGSKESMFKEIADEVKSFKPILVYDDKTLEKSIKMWRPAQIAWDEATDDITKSRTGVYLNTTLNKSLGRVGMRYEAKIEAE